MPVLASEPIDYAYEMVVAEIAADAADAAILTPAQQTQRLEYGPCAASDDTFHTWSMCYHNWSGFEHAACVYCHIDY